MTDAAIRVIVAEDEFLIAMDLADSLHAAGIEVVAVTPTLDGARAAVRARPDIHAAVLDIDLRGQKVYPLVDELIARDVPVVFATGYDMSVIPERYRAIDRCVKPIESNVLVASVRRAAVNLQGRPA